MTASDILSIIAICVSVFFSIYNWIETHRLHKKLKLQEQLSVIYRDDIQPTSCLILDSDKKQFHLNVQRNEKNLWLYGIYVFIRQERGYMVMITENEICAPSQVFYTKYACITHALNSSN